MGREWGHAGVGNLTYKGIKAKKMEKPSHGKEPLSEFGMVVCWVVGACLRRLKVPTDAPLSCDQWETLKGSKPLYSVNMCINVYDVLVSI